MAFFCALILLSLQGGWADARPPYPKPKTPIRVVVVTTFELGADTGDAPGEFQTWVERLPLERTFPFPAGNRALRYNAKKHVLGVVVGSGSVNAAASIMALGLDPRFDLTKAYWLVAGIAGVNPNVGSVGSAAWAEWVVDRDLTMEIDARELPPGWSTGFVPLSRSRPFEAPPPSPGIYSPNVYHLDEGLVAWAYHLTRSTPLEDSETLRAVRSGYPGEPRAQTPPLVMKGDEISAMDWWVGARMNSLAEQWMDYWTGAKGVMAMSAMEDSGVLRALQMLGRAGRVNFRRTLILRTASDYTVPPDGQSAAKLIADEASSDTATHLTAYRPALAAAYAVGSAVVNELSGGWRRWRDAAPTDVP